MMWAILILLILILLGVGLLAYALISVITDDEE